MLVPIGGEKGFAPQSNFSKNVVGATVDRTGTGLVSAIRLSFPYSKCKTLAARKTPCSRAASAAAAHNASGIGKRALCPFLQCSKRRQTLRMPPGTMSRVANGLAKL
jgi:hypothetical protein